MRTRERNKSYLEPTTVAPKTNRTKYLLHVATRRGAFFLLRFWCE